MINFTLNILYRQDPCHILSEKAVFGYGCNYDEHVKYGMCLDGQCARRAKWEDVLRFNSILNIFHLLILLFVDYFIIK